MNTAEGYIAAVVLLPFFGTSGVFLLASLLSTNIHFFAFLTMAI